MKVFTLFCCCTIWSAKALVVPVSSQSNTFPFATAEQEVDRFAQDVETVLKKLRPSEADPSIKGMYALFMFSL
jgi:CRISPR/Cas system CMR subunit Cmr4 (Cas7 group RAMP superfamily)